MKIRNRTPKVLAAVIVSFAAAASIGAPGPQRGTGTWIEPADAADLDFDGLVDDADFVLFSLQYDALECNAPNMPDECSADINHDGQVDDADFVIFVREYNRILPAVS